MSLSYVCLSFTLGIGKTSRAKNRPFESRSGDKILVCFVPPLEICGDHLAHPFGELLVLFILGAEEYELGSTVSRTNFGSAIYPDLHSALGFYLGLEHRQRR